LGYPGENDDDLKKTKNYVKYLTKSGIDEIALFIMTPIPGTRTFGSLTGYKDFSDLTFSPAWREDFKELNKYRIKIYLLFFMYKLFIHPIKVWKQFINLLTKKFENKAEMNIYRYYKIKRLARSLKAI